MLVVVFPKIMMAYDPCRFVADVMALESYSPRLPIHIDVSKMEKLKSSAVGFQVVCACKCSWDGRLGSSNNKLKSSGGVVGS